MFLRLFHSFDETIQRATVVYISSCCGVCHQNIPMSSSCSNVCVICEKGATSSSQLLDKPEMTEELVRCCKERHCLGQSERKDIVDRVNNYSELQQSIFYHGACRKSLVNKFMMERLKEKRLLSSCQ